MPRTESPVRGRSGVWRLLPGGWWRVPAGLGIPGTAQTAAPGEKKVCRVTTKDVCYWRSIWIVSVSAGLLIGRASATRLLRWWGVAKGGSHPHGLPPTPHRPRFLPPPSTPLLCPRERERLYMRLSVPAIWTTKLPPYRFYPSRSSSPDSDWALGWPFPSTYLAYADQPRICS